MKQRREFLVFEVELCSVICEGVDDSSVESYEILELLKEDTVPKEEQRFEEKLSKKFRHNLNVVNIQHGYWVMLDDAAAF